MFLNKLGLTALVGALGLGLAGCNDGYGYGGVGVGYGAAGYGYDDYGYDGYGGGYGYGGYGGGYGYGGYGGGYGYAPSYFGWYNNFYYPGTGIYVYDRNRRAYRWNDQQRRYWGNRRNGFQDRDVRQNWGDFRRDVRQERRDYRGDIRDNREALRNGTITQDQFRQGRRDARQEYRSDVRQDFRDLRRQNRAEGYRTPRPNRAFRPRANRVAPANRVPTRNYRPIRPGR